MHLRRGLHKFSGQTSYYAQGSLNWTSKCLSTLLVVGAFNALKEAVIGRKGTSGCSPGRLHGHVDIHMSGSG